MSPPIPVGPATIPTASGSRLDGDRQRAEGAGSQVTQRQVVLIRLEFSQATWSVPKCSSIWVRTIWGVVMTVAAMRLAR
jgi:hypothetical protein